MPIRRSRRGKTSTAATHVRGCRAAVPSERALFRKIRSLPPERVLEVEDFVEFLRTRAGDRTISDDALRLSQESFARIWSNPEDAAYDE